MGGRRSGSGRKRIHSPGVAHRVRETLNRRTPLHINFRYRTHIRNKTTFRLLKRAILNGRKKSLRIIHFSFQKNHVHLIIEADSNAVLTKGMRSVTVTMAMGLKKGRVQTQRYHLHVLKSLRETKNAVHYVLFNEQKHEKSAGGPGDSTTGEYNSILSLQNAMELIRDFMVKNKRMIRIVKGEDWLPDKAGSHLLKLVSC
ncbi:MAG: hypothetical protein V4598_04180 [Bdellovibrionota bacterium]